MKLIIILENNLRINADMIESYRPAANDPNKTIIGFARTGSQLVADITVEKLDQLITDAGNRNVSHLNSIARRLTESLDRLSARIPSSIRMHM